MRRALVTGGTRGIGFEVCKLLLEMGYCVTALYSKDEKSAKEAQARLKDVSFIRADVAVEEDVKRVFEEIPSLDLLVNNAGVELYKLVQDTSFSEWRRVMEVNAGGTFLCAKYAVAKMLDAGGAIVNISSVWGQTGGSMEQIRYGGGSFRKRRLVYVSPKTKITIAFQTLLLQFSKVEFIFLRSTHSRTIDFSQKYLIIVAWTKQNSVKSSVKILRV